VNSFLINIGVKYALDRLSEPSTWASIAAGIAGELAIKFNPDFTNAFVHLGLAATVLAGVLIKEGAKK